MVLSRLGQIYFLAGRHASTPPGGSETRPYDPAPRRPAGRAENTPVADASSVGCAVFVDEAPLAIRSECRLDVVLRIGHRVPGNAIADFDEQHVGRGTIDQMMRDARACLEA